MNVLARHEEHIFRLVLSGILLAVSALFLWNINEHGFWMDEMYHALGAQYVLAEGVPVFPTGDIYERAMGYTYLVALSYKLFGVSEFAGRLPSFVFLFLFVIAGGYIVRKLLGTYPALLFLLLLALSPISMELARFSRMYTAFAFFYFLGAWTFFYGFERSTARPGNDFWSRPLFGFETNLDINIKLLLLSLLFFYLSYSMHRLTMTFSVAFGSYVFFQFINLVIKDSFSRALRTKYGVTLLAGIACLLGLLAFSGEFIAELNKLVFTKTLWAEKLELTPSYYRYFLTESYPFFFFAYPVAIIYLIHRHRNIGLFVLANSLVLLLLHSFVIEMKQYRYVYYVLPFFYLSGVLLAVDLVRYIWQQLENLSEFRLFWVRAICVFSMLAFLNVFTYPWLNDAKKVPSKHPDVNWKAFSARAIPKMDPDIPVIATDQLTYLYYFGKKPDYYLRLNYHEIPDDSEHYAGSSPVASFEEFRALCEREDDLYLVSKRLKLTYYVYSNTAIREYIDEHFEQVKLDGINDIHLYRKIN